MRERIHVQTQTPATAAPDRAIASTKLQKRAFNEEESETKAVGQFDSRPFSVSTPPPDQRTLGDTAKYGFNFANISIFPPLSASSAAPAQIQPKLVVGTGDKYEQEVDSMAETEEKVEPIVQHLHQNFLQNRVNRASVSPQQPETQDLQAQLDKARRLGHNFADISVSSPSPAYPAAPDQVQPKLVVGQPGNKYDPSSNVGKELFTHELTYVVQQTGGTQSKSSETKERNILASESNQLNQSLSTQAFQEVFVQRDVEYNEGHPVRAVEHFTIPANRDDFERQIIDWINNLVERERAPRLVRSSTTFSELWSSLRESSGASVEITAELIWNPTQVTEVRFSIPTVTFNPDETERIEGTPWLHLRDARIRAIVRQLHGSSREIERNTAQRIIDGDITVMYFDELTPVRNEAEMLQGMDLDPASYRLYWHPEPQSSGQAYFPALRAGKAMSLPRSSIIVLNRNTLINNVLLREVVHEVNHAVNRSIDGDIYDINTHYQDHIFGNYRSEFRAYWVSDPVAQNITNLDWRATRIREYILEHYTDIGEAYHNPELEVRERINNHTRPDGNLTNE